MDATQFPDFAESIRYALSHRPLADDRIDIVLDLYRGSVPALTRTIARVTDAEVGPVTLKCRSYLERRGAHAVANFSLGVPPSWRARGGTGPVAGRPRGGLRLDVRRIGRPAGAGTPRHTAAGDRSGLGRLPLAVPTCLSRGRTQPAVSAGGAHPDPGVV